jgi:enamine deaminase RidA (YjgF/YER057c/UK114 family)
VPTTGCVPVVLRDLTTHFFWGFVTMTGKIRRAALSAICFGLPILLASASGVAEAGAQVVYPLTGAPYPAAIMAPAGSTLAVIGGIEGTGADMAAASTDALNRLEARLVEVGLNRSHLLRVRAGLAPGAAGPSDFDGWNRAWTGFFGSGHVPARVTVGASAVPGTARLVLDAVAHFPAELGLPARVEGARETLNPNIRLAGPASNPTAIVSTRAGLFLSSGMLPNPNNLADAESMDQQIRNTMNILTGVLANHGLQWYDAFFVRVLPTPQPSRSDVDFAAWGPVYSELAAMTGGRGPAFTEWAAPGFSATRRYVEVEVWAAPQAPHPAFEVFDMEMQNPLLRMTGTGFISDGAIIAPNAELAFLSGIVAPQGTEPGQEGAAVLNLMRERLAQMGASMSDVAELRVYRVEGEDGFNAAYSANFNNPDNPHRPVRTNYLVGSLPSGRMVEVEAIVVRPPKRF